MNFLTPWFLLGGIAIAGPILFHLIRRAARERTTFSSLMFLRATPPRVTRRRKLEHFWLLLLRCLVLLLLAAAFARPYLTADIALPAPPAQGRQLVLLIDTSASMRREGLWGKAKAVADRYFKQASLADEVAVVTFDRQPRSVVAFSEWSGWSPDQRAALARQRLAAITPGWMATHLGLALSAATERFVDDSASGKPPAHRDVVLISDMQEGAKLDGLQGHEWPKDVKVVIERLDAKAGANAGLEIMPDPKAGSGTAHTVPVRVTNSRDSSREKFTLAWEPVGGAGSPGESMEIYLPPGQTRSFSAPKLPASTTVEELRLAGDDEKFDNTSFYAAPEAERVTVAYFGSESGNDPAAPRYYLQRVFSGIPRKEVVLAGPAPGTGISPDTLNASLLAVIPGRLAAEDITRVHDWIAGGKTALLVLVDAQMGPTLEGLSGLSGITMADGTGDFALLGDVDFTHPLFAPFAEPRFSDFAHIHFWKHRRWAIPSGAPARVLAKFDDGSPALAQLPVGKGNLLVLAAGWQPSDSQFAVSSKFPPLMETLLDWSGAGAPVRFQFSTGDSIPSPAAAGNGEVQWQNPDGKTVQLAGGTAFNGTDTPGVYTASFAGKSRRFAVNLPLDESRTAPLSPDELMRLGVPLETSVDTTETQTQLRQLHLAQAELENRQKLWRWLLAGVLGITFGEILLAGWLSRRVQTAEAVR
jgi:hypothetical protein